MIKIVIKSGFGEFFCGRRMAQYLVNNGAIRLIDVVFEDGENKYKFIGNNKEDRTNEALVYYIEKIVKEYGSERIGLKVIEIPDDINWIVSEDDETGIEFVEEVHKKWY